MYVCMYVYIYIERDLVHSHDGRLNQQCSGRNGCFFVSHRQVNGGLVQDRASQGGQIARSHAEVTPVISA